MSRFNDDQYYQYPPYGFAPRPLSHGALGTQHQDTFVFSNVGKGPKGEKGEKGDKGDTGDTLKFSDLTTEEINRLVGMLAYVGTESEDAIFITTDPSTSVIPIPIDTYDEFDLLFVDINGLDLAYGVDYIISDGSIMLAQPLPEGQRVHFRALKYRIADAYKHITKVLASNAFATVDDVVGTPYVDVSADSDNNLYFDFHNIKGEQGDPGPALLFTDLTPEELASIYDNVSYVGTGEKTGTYTTTGSGETVIPIAIDDYDPDDILFVVVDGKTLIEGEDYTMGPNEGEITLTEPVPAGTKVHFRALGYNLPDGEKNIVINYNSGEAAIDWPIPIDKGGTSATSWLQARTNLNALGSAYLNGYYGIVYPNGGSGGWIRTPMLGLLPYQQDAANGYGSIGSASWPFANVYTKKINGKAPDSAASYTVTKSEKLSTNSTDKINPNTSFVKEFKFTPTAGYKPVGIVTIHKSGTNAGYLTINSFNMDGLGIGTESILKVTFRNIGSAAVTASAITVQYQVTCVKAQ